MDFGLSKEVLSQIRNIVNENKKYKFINTPAAKKFSRPRFLLR